MRKSTHEMFCLEHPRTVRERVGEVERVEVGRACAARICIAVDGERVDANVSRLLEMLADALGWRDGFCPEHAAQNFVIPPAE